MKKTCFIFSFPFRICRHLCFMLFYYSYLPVVFTLFTPDVIFDNSGID